MTKKRVLHVGLDTHLGGIETYLLKIASNIDREKYQFDFLMYDEKEPCFYNELKALGCQFHNVVSRRKNYFQNISDLKRLFQREHFDIVHCHQNSLSYITPILLAIRYGCHVIVHSHNAGNLSGIPVRIRHRINYYRLPLNKVTCVAVSDLAGSWMFGDKTKITVLNNGLDTELFCYSETYRNEIREEFNIGNKELIVHTGAFRKQKNHELLIDIFKAYHQRNPETILMLVGEGELRCEIEEKVKKLDLLNHVIFAGRRSDIPKILSAADKYLFPSFYEGFPNALIEAETAGLYCVAADTITRQVQIEGICEYVSLDAPLEEWVRVLEHDPVENRMKCADMVEAVGLGITAEMERINLLYEGSLE